MTRCATQGIPEQSKANRSGTASGHCSGRTPRPPKFVDHPELKGRWAYKKLFIDEADPTAADAAVDRELHRFKQLHFCGRRMRALLERYGPVAARRSDYQRFARLHQQFREDIASDNLGLVYSLCKRSRKGHVDGDELLSDGMMALTRAIDTFNPWLGFRFSTYACNAIVRAFSRCRLRESKRRQREPVSVESLIEKSDWLDTCRIEKSGLYVERLASILSKGTADLNSIEKEILAQRFSPGMGDQRCTLVQIGRRMSLSKERIRQVLKVALVKLRGTLEDDPVLSLGAHMARDRLACVLPENAVLLDTA